MNTKRVVLALCAMAGAAAPASASVFFTFDDPNAVHEVRYEQPVDAGPAYGTMTYAAGGAPTVDFVVDVSDETFKVGTGIHTFESELRWTNWEVMEVSDLGILRTASVMGEFEWYDTNSNQTVVSGSFTMGLVVESQSAGSVITATDSNLTYTPGQALLDIYPGLQFSPAWDGVYTLTDITFDSTKIVTVDTEEGEGDYFGSFSANAAFTGTTVATIPTPGAIALGAIGMGGLLRRRR